MAAIAVKRFASLQRSTPTAKFIGITVDTAADNKLSSTSQKLILKSTSIKAQNISTQKLFQAQTVNRSSKFWDLVARQVLSHILHNIHVLL
jgi:hypothetical protein